jgi:uncharacterized protein (TIGR03663 family)
LRPRAILLGSILLAAALRFPDLAHRPMHADEAVHADKLGTLLEGGGYAYDPTEYHGPTLYYLTLPSAWLRGEARYAALDEVTLRAVPAAFGVALVAAHFGARAFLGPAGAGFAALLLAISPAMVFYSRYFIHETLLVSFSFCALLAVGRYLRRPGPGWAALAGAAAGAMQATKETAPIAMACGVAALLVCAVLARRSGGPAPAPGWRVGSRHALLALAVASLVSTLLFTSFLTRWGGVADALRTYATWLERARAASWHVHPWDYYLGLLIRFPSEGSPVWSEGLILVLAVVGAGAGWSRGGQPGADPGALRFLSLYTLLMVAAYSAIPYKTPWCLLGFLHGLILLAGAGAARLLQAARTRARFALTAAVLVAALAHLGWLAWAASFRFAADPRNPWVYAHTGTGVPSAARRIGELTRAHPDGASMPIQIFSRENPWPLPWYLRGFPGVRWWDGVSDDAGVAPLVVVTPELEGALARRLYDVPPPGERELYLRLFERPVELRPGVELRGYVAKSLWDAFQRLEARRLEETSPASEPGGRE